jgi:Zn-dependent peptidase ImmA (M78 family)/transcriptional regulator with XRE-family HTH domain
MNRIRQLRLARGLSLEGLAVEMGGIVTRQALHLYEQGSARPSPGVTVQLAKALRVKPSDLNEPALFEVEFIAYRSRSGLRKRDGESIKAYFGTQLERRAQLQARCCPGLPFDLPLQRLKVQTLEDAEEASKQLRDKWCLGRDAIGDLTVVLEDHLVHVIRIEASEKFDGLSAIVREHGKPVAVGVASRAGVPGDRQRFSLAHELAHLVMKIEGGLDAEKAAHRFAGAFLLPEAAVRREIGDKRSSLLPSELRLLKRRFKVSLQAIVKRLHDLRIISDPVYKSAFFMISRYGWRKVEPDPIAPENSEWCRQVAARGLAEKQLTAVEVERLTGLEFAGDVPTSLLRKTQFRRLPMAERRKILEREAARLAKHYEKPSEWQLLESEDFHDQ